MTDEQRKQELDRLAEVLVEKLADLDDQIELVADQVVASIEAKLDQKIEEKLRDRLEP